MTETPPGGFPDACKVESSHLPESNESHAGSELDR